MPDAVARPSLWTWWLLTLAAWLGVFILRALGLGGLWTDVSVSTGLVLCLWLITYSAGFFGGALTQQKPVLRRAFPEPGWYHRWIMRLAALAALGAAMIVFEFAVLRGYGFSTDVAVVRINEVANSRDGFTGSGISGIGRLLTPALIPAWLIALMSPHRIGRWRWAALAVATLAVFYQQTAFEGGRFFMAAFVLSAFVAYAMGRRFKRKPGAKTDVKRLALQIIAILALLSLVLFFFGKVFIDRVSVTYPSLSAAYQTFSGNFPLLVRDVDYARLEAGGPVWFVIDMFWVYTTHAVSEFEILFQTPDLAHAWGTIQFTQLSKAITLLTGVNAGYDVFENLPKAGVYLTFPGVNYIDFGLTGMFVSALLLGVLQALSLGRLGRGRLSGFGLAAPLFVVIALFSPVHSLVSNLWPAIFWAFAAAWASRDRAASFTPPNRDRKRHARPA